MDSLTDEHNLWLNAMRSEDNHDYYSATLVYLEDMGLSLKNGSFEKAAISCSCAAADLVHLGDLRDAISLYEEAGKIYEGNADLAMGYSIREALWSLTHAYEYYYLISDSASADRVSKNYLSISKKIDHFRGEENASHLLRNLREKVNEARSMMEPAQNYSDTITPTALSQIRKAIAKALEISRTRSPEPSMPAAPAQKDEPRSSFDYDRNIVS
jgi:hypothetical protein